SSSDGGWPSRGTPTGLIVPQGLPPRTASVAVTRLPERGPQKGAWCETRSAADSRWGHHGDVVVIFAPKFSSPGGRECESFFHSPSLSNVSNACWTSCCVILV